MYNLQNGIQFETIPTPSDFKHRDYLSIYIAVHLAVYVFDCNVRWVPCEGVWMWSLLKFCISLCQLTNKRPVGLSSFVNCPPVVASFLTQRQLSVIAGWQHMGRVPHPYYINPGYGLSLVDTLWNASSYRQPLEQEGDPMTWIEKFWLQISLIVAKK